MNLFTPVKKFIKMNRENKAWSLLCIGFIGCLSAVILERFKLLPQTTATEFAVGTFVAIFGIGSLTMCTYFIKHEDKAARFAGCGAFGFLGLGCTECIIDYMVKHLTSVTLPQITIWYAYPCIIMFAIGILILAGQAIFETWKRA